MAVVSMPVMRAMAMHGFCAHNNASSTMAAAAAAATPYASFASFTRTTLFAYTFFTYVFVWTASYASFTRATPFADNGSFARAPLFAFARATLFANAWHILYMKIIYDIFFDQGLI